ncbi:CPBP family intramembrane glutamic endopeptidase [Rossellomorea sp. YZS02]|uniref:CPBP family intramembrane glutamic endopeptidase n=1 Tax=Rossellomorea sp. YZS02 TaxID=3097358 RepID=UPI002A0C67D9|nr:CPBP family intramembrane glutamic endopeptidase [Rossellomorea sp. YZS02]MDX8344944.1 CPBP family intramembrane glutamic endopeptidase [Rossellomorea sp. YZS02]
MFKKTVMLLTIFFIAFGLENVKLPDDVYFIQGIPRTLMFKLENRLFVLTFFIILLLIYRRKYHHVFSLDVLKDRKMYVWVIITLMCVTFLKQASIGFEDTFGLIRLPQLSTFHLFFLLLNVCLIVPIQEELLYRGLLIIVPSKRWKVVMLISSSITFALLHTYPLQIIWLGLGLGVLALRFNNLWVPIIAHSLWNLLVTYINL